MHLLKLAKLRKGSSLDLSKWVTSRVDRDFRIDHKIIATCQEELRGSRDKRKRQVKDKKESTSAKPMKKNKNSSVIEVHPIRTVFSLLKHLSTFFQGLKRKKGIKTPPHKIGRLISSTVAGNLVAVRRVGRYVQELPCLKIGCIITRTAPVPVWPTAYKFCLQQQQWFPGYGTTLPVVVCVHDVCRLLFNTIDSNRRKLIFSATTVLYRPPPPLP